MKLFAAREENSQETRVALLPTDADKLVKLGIEVLVETGIGKSIGIEDGEYEKTGAVIAKERLKGLSQVDMVLSLGIPSGDDISKLGKECIFLGCLNPFNNIDTVKKLAAGGINAISLEMIPRTTIAQKMDVLSSQANLAGYVAVVIAAERLKKIFPMMMTPAGTIRPARVFIIGAGVAGLQAIATAKRLGARVDAFDVRPEAQEQILSLGAKPLTVELGETGKTKDGYAKQLTDEQLEKQRQAMAKMCSESDVVITTAKVFGKKAPVIVTNEMLDGMKAGSIVVDLAVDTGGNVEASELGKETERKGVMIIGTPELQRLVPETASRMFSSNLYNFIEHFWGKENKTFKLNLEDEIIQGCLITHQGEIINKSIKDLTG